MRLSALPWYGESEGSIDTNMSDGEGTKSTTPQKGISKSTSSKDTSLKSTVPKESPPLPKKVKSPSESMFPVGVFIGDPHFQPSSFKMCEVFVKKCLDEVQKHSPCFIVVLGDILHTHDTIKTNSMNQAHDFLIALSDVAHVFVLVGNHDYINNSQFLSTKHHMNSLKFHPRLTVVDHVVKQKFASLEFVFCPYVPAGRFVEALDTCQGWRDAHCVFAHQDIRGFLQDTSTGVPTVGDKWKRSWPFLVSGHIHDHQQSHNVYYTGSSMQIDANENDNKRLCVARFPLTCVSDIQRIDLQLPKKHLVKLSVEEVYEYEVPVEWKKDQVKMHVRGLREELAVFRRSALYGKLKKQGVIILTKVDAEEFHKATAISSFKELLLEIVKTKASPVMRIYNEMCRE